MHPAIRCLAAGLAVLLSLAVDRPAGATRANEASAHVAAAIASYRAGDYDHALAELEVGYAIEPRLEFLISFAQVYGALGRYAEGIDRCNRYLDAAPGSSLAPDVERLRGELRARREHAESARAVFTPPPAPSPPVVTRVAAVPPPPTTAPDHDRARRRRIAWGVGTSAVVVAVGLGLGLGLGFGLPDAVPATRLGTVSFR